MNSKRLKNLKEIMLRNNICALLVTSAANRFYLSHFEMHDGQCNESSGCLLITNTKNDWLLTDARFTEAAKKAWPEDQIFVYGSPRVAKIGEFIQQIGIKQLWVETQSMCAEMYLELRQYTELQAAPHLIEELRAVKDADEVDILRKSCALNHLVYDELYPCLVPDVSEQDIAWTLEKLFRDNGANELSFAPIVGFGPNGALPHASPGKTKLQNNMPVLIDMGGRLDNYCSNCLEKRPYVSQNSRDASTKLLSSVSSNTRPA